MVDVPVYVQSTAYAPCSSGAVMANGRRVHEGAAAGNRWSLGTRLRISPAFYGRRRFTVEDRIGSGSELDLWTPSCTAAVAWGRRTVRVRVGWPRPVLVLRKIAHRRIWP